jgi:hypothetical protein
MHRQHHPRGRLLPRRQRHNRQIPIRRRIRYSHRYLVQPHRARGQRRANQRSRKLPNRRPKACSPNPTQLLLIVERLDPCSVTHPPGAIPGWNEAPFTTYVIAGGPAVAVGGIRGDIEIHVPGVPTRRCPIEFEAHRTARAVPRSRRELAALRQVIGIPPRLEAPQQRFALRSAKTR